MKKSYIFAVLAALGAASTSCQDTTYSEVEETVLKDQILSQSDIEDDDRDKPGSH